MKFNIIKIFAVVFFFGLMPLIPVNAVSEECKADPAKCTTADGLELSGETIYGKDAKVKVSESTNRVYSTLGNLIQSLLTLLGVVFMLLIIYGGVLWMLAGGEEQKITKSRQVMTNAAIGLAIVLLAYSISYFVVDTLSTAVK